MFPDDDRPDAGEMAPDDAAEAIADAAGMAPDCGGDLVYQAGFRAGRAADPLGLVRAATDFLAAEFDRGEPGSLEDATIRDARIACGQRLIRIFAADIDALDD